MTATTTSDLAAAAPSNTTATAARGRPSLGDRQHVTAALWPSLIALVDQSRGPLDRSPYLADLLAWHLGRPDLIRHTQLVLDFTGLSRRPRQAPRPPRTRTHHCTVRVHPDVAHALHRGATESGQPRAVFIADAIAASLGVRRDRAVSTQKGLPLAM